MIQLNIDEAEKYCVFESNQNWFSFPSLNIRCVIPRPAITPLPHSDPVVVGLSHVQNEFLPVVSLRSLLDLQYEATNSEQQLMIFSGAQSPWGLLIDRATDLTTLEVSISALADGNDDWSKVVTGSATYKNQVLQVLDTDAIYRYVVKFTR